SAGAGPLTCSPPSSQSADERTPGRERAEKIDSLDSRVLRAGGTGLAGGALEAVKASIATQASSYGLGLRDDGRFAQSTDERRSHRPRRAPSAALTPSILPSICCDVGWNSHVRTGA